MATYLGLSVGRLANRCSTQCFWDTGRDNVQQVFARNALPMVWVFAEANPFSDSSGNFLGQLEYLARALEAVPAAGPGSVRQADAASGGWPAPVCVSTDPPYYDNVPYADLSDFFYVWLRRAIAGIHPDLFRTLLVPKAEELIAEPARHGDWGAAAAFFENGLRRVFSHVRAYQGQGYPCTIFYAFKQAEEQTRGVDGRASTGWETLLQGLVDSALEVTGTWPIRTEQTGGLRELGRNALASSIVLVCRSRPEGAGITTRGKFFAELKRKLPDALRTMRHGNIAPVDLAQAAIGPGMAVFSHYEKVLESDGNPMRVRTALQLINQVLDEVLTEQEGEFDAETRWALAWFDQHGMDEGPYGVAEILSKAKNTAVSGLVEAGILKSGGGKVRLLGRGELPEEWDPAADGRLTVWEVTQHLIRALEDEGESGAAALLRRVGGLGEVARDLAYRLYSTCERKGWAQEARAYNGLVTSWREVSDLARREPAAAGPAQAELGV